MKTDFICLLLNFIWNHPHIFQISVDLFLLWELFEESNLLPRFWTKTVGSLLGNQKYWKK